MVQFSRWPTESFLKFLIFFVSAVGWLLLAMSVVGLVYALLLAFILFIMQLGLTAHIRGNAVRISEQQFPELHHTFVKLSQKAGLKTLPEAYVVESGGVLNAVAMRWLGSSMVLLYSDLIRACSDRPETLEFVVGHELGHIACGHLRATWFLLPGLSFPFLGKAYTRAMEFTCDRFAEVLIGNREAALRGLTLLAAGSTMGAQVNVEVFVKQRQSLQTIAMTIGRWMATHPPLCDRVLALLPEHGQVTYRTANLKALGLMLALVTLPFALLIVAKS